MNGTPTIWTLAIVAVLFLPNSAQSTYGPYKPTAAQVDSLLGEACETAAYVVLGTVVDTTFVERPVSSTSPIPIWTEVRMAVDKYLAGPTIEDSNLVFMTPGGWIGKQQLLIGNQVRLEPGQRYVVFLSQCPEEVPRITHSRLTTHVTGDTAIVGSRAKLVPLEGLLASLDEKLRVRDPMWQRAHSDIVLEGTVAKIGLEIRKDGTYRRSGTILVTVDSVPSNPAGYPLEQGSAVTILVRPNLTTFPPFELGESAILFLTRTASDSLQLRPSLWAKWTRNGDHAEAKNAPGCGDPTTMKRLLWSTLVSMLAR